MVVALISGLFATGRYITFKSYVLALATFDPAPDSGEATFGRLAHFFGRDRRPCRRDGSARGLTEALRRHNKGRPREISQVRGPDALKLVKDDQSDLTALLESLAGKLCEKGNSK